MSSTRQKSWFHLDSELKTDYRIIESFSWHLTEQEVKICICMPTSAQNYLYICVCVCVCVCTKLLQSCPTLRPYGLQPTRLHRPWNSPGKNTGVVYHAFLQGIFPTQVSNASRMCPTLADWLFTTSASWDAPNGSVSKEFPAMQEIQEMQFQSLYLEDPLEEERATHSNILGWKIPWTEESGGLQSKGSKRATHDWVHSKKYYIYGTSYFILYPLIYW